MVTEECNKSCLIVEVIVIVFPPACRISLTFFFARIRIIFERLSFFYVVDLVLSQYLPYIAFFKIRSVSTSLSLPSLSQFFFHVALFQVYYVPAPTVLQKDLRYRCLLKCLRDKGGWDCFFYLASILKYLTNNACSGPGLQWIPRRF